MRRWTRTGGELGPLWWSWLRRAPDKRRRIWAGIEPVIEGGFDSPDRRCTGFAIFAGPHLIAFGHDTRELRKS